MERRMLSFLKLDLCSSTFEKLGSKYETVILTKLSRQNFICKKTKCEKSHRHLTGGKRAACFCWANANIGVKWITSVSRWKNSSKISRAWKCLLWEAKVFKIKLLGGFKRWSQISIFLSALLNIAKKWRKCRLSSSENRGLQLFVYFADERTTLKLALLIFYSSFLGLKELF